MAPSASSLTLSDAFTVLQKVYGDSRHVGVTEALRSLTKHIQTLGNPDLSLVAFGGLHAGFVSLADVGLRVYALYVRKPIGSTTDAWLKIGSDIGGVAPGYGDLVVYLRGTNGGGRAYCLVFHDGLPIELLSNAIIVASQTEVDGTTDSDAADAPSGFVIIGAQ